MRSFGLIIIALAACSPAHRRQTDYVSGSEVYSSANLQVEVTRVRVKKYKLEVRFVFTNLTDGPFAFKRNDVILAYGENKIAPRENWMIGERDVDFARKGQTKKKTYIFHVVPKGTEITAGDYQITVGGTQGGGGVFGGSALTFTIKIP